MTTAPKLSIWLKTLLWIIGTFGFISLFFGVLSMFIWLWFDAPIAMGGRFSRLQFLFSDGVLSMSFGERYGVPWFGGDNFFEIQTALPKPSISCLLGFRVNAFEDGSFIHVPLIGPALTSLLTFWILVLKVVTARRKTIFADLTSNQRLQ